MLTRAFLVLLAMMTGLSAAQAADFSRPAAERTAVSKSIVQLVHDRADSCAARVVQVAYFSETHSTYRHGTARLTQNDVSIVPVPRVLRSDRRRQ
jgi:hypothetical protein